MRTFWLAALLLPLLLAAAPAARPAPATPAAPAPAPTPTPTPAPAPAPSGAAVDTGGAPSMDQLIDLLTQQKYQDLLKGVTKALALRGAASQPYNRADLLMLRGEAYLHLKQNAQAAESFAQAAKVADDADKRAIAQATELLIKRSKPTGYLPRTASTQPAIKQGTPLPIMDKEERKIAFSALLEDELAVAAPRIKAATASNSLLPVIETGRSLSDIRAIELASGEGDKLTKQVSERLGQHAHTLLKDALKSMETHIEDIWNAASRMQSHGVVDAQTGVRQERYRAMMGLTSTQSNDLKGTIGTLEKIVPVANDLAALTGENELSADASDADRLLKRAHEVLEYNYSESSGGTSSSQTPQTRQQPTRTPTPTRK
jgi:hypothetical protein